MDKYILNTDGGARGNPGPGAVGAVIRDSKQTIIYEQGKYLGICTNNEAEYNALIEGLKAALQKNITFIECRLDSELVVKQLTGVYRVKDSRMQALWTEVKALEKNFTSISYSYVPRAQNKEADKLVNQVLDSAMKDQ